MSDPLKIINKKKNLLCKSKLNFTCLTENMILELVNIYNTTFCDNNINFCLKNKIINIKNRKIKDIYNELKNKLKIYNNLYKEEKYWKKINEFAQVFLNNNYYYLPKMPYEWCDTIKDWRATLNAPWLSNYDIDDVIIKYEKKYNDFKFLGSIPIDFRKKRYGSCTLDMFMNNPSNSWLSFNKEKNNKYCNFNPTIFKDKKYFGIVFNTDTYDGPGKHWMSMYISLNKKKPCILFFDSACTYPNLHHEIRGFINNIKTIYPNIDFEVKYNTKTHQTSNSECGMYSIYFILCMVDSDKNNNNCLNTFNKYFNNEKFTIHDKLMILYRTKLFDSSVCKKIQLENIE